MTVKQKFHASAWGLILAAAILTSCHKNGKEEAKTQPPAPVSVAKASVADVPIRLMAVGVVEAGAVVNIKAQVGGVLRQVHFREGAEVKKGDTLFTLDSRMQEAALKQAEANLARDKAQMENSRAILRRNSELLKDNFVSAERVEQLKTETAAMEGAMKASEAAVESARLQLEYCVIVSPISGVAGELAADAGNLVKPNDDKPLTVIRQVQPVFVAFSAPERSLAQVRAAMAAGQMWAEAAVEGGASPAPRGKVVFVDNSVDQATGTVRMKAEFPNEKKILWPGQFVSVRLEIGARAGVVTIPARAVQMGQKGAYVYVVAGDNKAELRLVSIAVETEGTAVVEKGLAEGETVVTEGHIKVAPGASLVVKETEGDGKGGK